MKTTLLSLLLAVSIPMVSSAKVEDFNALIKENSQAQNQLHESLKEQLGEPRLALKKGSGNDFKKVITAQDSANSPTNKALLSFEKEGRYYRASEAKKMQRLANEIKELDGAF